MVGGVNKICPEIGEPVDWSVTVQGGGRARRITQTESESDS